MARRPSRTLWRHLGADLSRLVAITALILVVVISFALSIKFLADGKIDLGGAILVMGLAALPMLQYALPFAGGFAATLTYHRFTSDHEASAAMAGGVSHRSLIVPALAIGLVLCAATLVLAHLVIPHVLRSMERQVRSDLTGVLERTIERGDSIEFGGLQIHADSMLPLGPDHAIGATDRFQLRGVLAIRTSEGNHVQGYTLAETVNAWMFEESSEDGPVTTVQLEFINATGVMNDQIYDASGSHTRRIPIGNAFVEDPKFNTYAELRALREHPENMRNIESLRRLLSLTLAQRERIEAIRARLLAQGRVVFDRAGGERLVLSAADMVRDEHGWKLTPGAPGGPIRIDRTQPGLQPFIQSAADAWIVLDEDPALLKDRIPEPLVRLVLDDPRTIDTRSQGNPGAQERALITALALVSTAPRRTEPIGVREALQTAQSVLANPDVELRQAIERAVFRLDYRHGELLREVTSRLHERAAHAFASLLTVLVGAIAALRRAWAMPLPVYLISFFPALGVVIIIDAGQSVAVESGWPGLVLMWGGLVLLAAFALFEYTRLIRH